LGILTLSPYLADPEYEEIAVSSLELDEAMDPQKYKATMAELKKTYDKAGRKTAKHETSHGIIRFRAQGYVFVDLEWGMGLEGYITKIQGSGQPLNFSEPVCIYKVLSLETKISDPKVFVN
jgi:beta-galactosidase GanA